MSVIDQLEQVVEKLMQPGVLGLPGRRLEKRCAKELGTYFKSLKVDGLARIVMGEVTPEMGKHIAANQLHNIVRKARPALMLVLKSNLHDAVLTARKHEHVAESLVQEYSDDQPRDDHGQWTDGGGGVLFHGTNTPSRPFTSSSRPVYLSTDHHETVAFAKGKIPGTGGKGRTPTTLRIEAKPGITHNIDEHIIDNMENGDSNPDKVIENYKHDHPEVRYVTFTHPSSVHGGDFKAVVSLYPHEDLKRAGGWRLSKEADQPFNKLGQTLFDAADWAEQQAADLVAGLDDTTIDLLSDAVATGIEDQSGVGGTGRLIRDAIDDMSVGRALMIASTEINRAFSTATMEQLGNQGVEYKQIVLSPDACPICQDNADSDPLPIDEDYDSGDGFPPFHPNCRCAITAARAPESED